MGCRSYIGFAAAAVFAASGFAQVSVTSTNRVWSSNGCVHAPPNNPNWCEVFSGSDTSTAPYIDGHSTGIGSSGGIHSDEGFANSICAASQSSILTSTHFEIQCEVWAEIDSAGICSSSSVASTYVAIRFTVVTPQVVTLVLTGTLIGNAPLETTLSPVGGSPLFSSSGLHSDIKRTLQPGNYEYITRATADGNCSGSCAHKERDLWSADVYFEAAPCAADFNGDNLVEDSDFVIFAVAYNDLICPDAPAACPCDLNGDGQVDDSDFVVFVNAYNELVCP